MSRRDERAREHGHISMKRLGYHILRIEIDTLTVTHNRHTTLLHQRNNKKEEDHHTTALLGRPTRILASCPHFPTSHRPTQIFLFIASYVSLRPSTRPENHRQVPEKKKDTASRNFLRNLADSGLKEEAVSPAELKGFYSTRT